MVKTTASLAHPYDTARERQKRAKMTILRDTSKVDNLSHVCPLEGSDLRDDFYSMG